MPTVSLTKTYGPDGTTLTTQELDDLKSSIETALNTTKLDSTNIQTGGIATANIASQAIDATKIASSAVGSGLTGGAGTALAVNVDASTISIASNIIGVTAGGIGTTQLAAGAVTQAKRASLGQQVSSSCSSFNTSSTSFVDVTNLAVTITTTGRPIFLSLVSDGDPTNSSILETSSGNGLAQWTRAGTRIGSFQIAVSGTIGGPTYFIDPVSAGTYTYKLQVKSISSVSVFVNYFVLVAFEL